MEREDHRPPHFALKLLVWFCPPWLLEGVEGDIVEQYSSDVKLYGRKKAARLFYWNVVRFVRPGIVLRNKFSHHLFHTIMIRNYFVIAFRNIKRHKAFSAINIFGLAIGLAACLLIFQFVTFELSYDKFNEKFDRIYRVTNDRFQHGKLIQHGTITYPTIGPAMAKDFPEVEAYTRLMPVWQVSIKAEDRVFRGNHGFFADEYFLSVFSFRLLAGDRKTSLADPNTIVITESTAKKYFDVLDGDYSGVIGKNVYLGLDPQPFKVTAVLENIPENSHLQFNILVSYTTLIKQEPQADDSWTWSDMRHYLVLKPGTDYHKLESKFEAFSAQHFDGDKVSGSVEEFFLQPLKDAHLYSDYEYDVAKTSSGRAVWAMLLVAGFILIIAWINYINLTTSRAVERAKEVGIRKVMGAIKTQLVNQFLFESVLVGLVALVFATVIVQASQSTFNEIIQGNLSWWKVLANLDVSTILIMAAVLLVGVLLSGFYPAFVLSAYQPATVLKGSFQRSSRGNFLRKALVVFQFTASAALITGTIIVSKQLKFMNEADLGINITNTVVVESPERTAWDSTFITRVETYKSELSKIPGVINSTTSNNVPGARLGRVFNVHWADEPSAQNFTMSFMAVDYSFFDTYQIALIQGRGFSSKDHHYDWDDITHVVLNKKAINLLGVKDSDEVVGKSVAFWDKTWTIIGVVDDFHQQGLKRPMEAMVFFPSYGTYQPTSIRIAGVNHKETLAKIETVFNRLFPDNAFEYSFLETTFKNQYLDDIRFSKIVNTFTVLAIIIACLGLIGLSSYTAVQRTKEIGIRKVLGASLYNIVALLSSNFLKLIIVACLLSLPIAYFTMHDWLATYAYRISLGWSLFAAPIALILLIAAATLSFQLLKAAMTNPVDTLKHE
jgi:putative ABC transport system permease protein